MSAICYTAFTREFGAQKDFFTEYKTAPNFSKYLSTNGWGGKTNPEGNWSENRVKCKTSQSCKALTLKKSYYSPPFFQAPKFVVDNKVFLQKKDRFTRLRKHPFYFEESIIRKLFPICERMNDMTGKTKLPRFVRYKVFIREQNQIKKRVLNNLDINSSKFLNLNLFCSFETWSKLNHFWTFWHSNEIDPVVILFIM